MFSNTGGGHRASGEALKEAFKEKYGDKYEVIELQNKDLPNFN